MISSVAFSDKRTEFVLAEIIDREKTSIHDDALFSSVGITSNPAEYLCVFFSVISCLVKMR